MSADTPSSQGPIKQKTAVALGCCQSHFDVTLVYPDYSQGFEIYTDSSKLQLDPVITQNNSPLTFFSRTESDIATVYHDQAKTTMAIIETLKRVQRHVLGTTTHGLHRPQISNAGCSWSDLCLSVPLGITPRRIWPHHCVYQGNPKHSCGCHFKTGLWTCPWWQVNLDDFCPMLVLP